MTAVHDDFTGSLSLITHPEEVANITTLIEQFRRLRRTLNPIIEMECMADYEYILEIYDGASALGQRVIQNEFPAATTTEEFMAVTERLEDAIRRLQAVERVLGICFVNNFIQFR